jgi:hypothetical protein
MAILSREKYSQQKIENLTDYLKTYEEMGDPIEYEIEVDGFKAVRRTNNPAMFSLFEKFVNGGTKAMEVTLYIGSSRNSDKHIFTFDSGEQEKGLSGIEVENILNERLKKERRDWEYEALVKDNKEWEEYAQELETDVTKLEKEIEELKGAKSPVQGMLGEFGSSLLAGFLKNNPKIIESIPGLSGLVDDQKSKSQKPIGEEINFSPAEEIKDEAKEALKFINHLRQHFLDEKFDKLMRVIDLMALDNSKLDVVFKQLTTV